MLKGNDETRNNFPDGLVELSVPGTYYDRQPHTHHTMTGQTAQRNQITEFLSGRNLSPSSTPSHQHPNLSTEVTQDNNLSMVHKHQGNKT